MPDKIEFLNVSPILYVRALERDLDYYVEQLGFAITWRFGEPAVRAGVAQATFELQLAEDASVEPCPQLAAYFHVHGVDAYYARCVAAGADVITPLDDRPFGVRDFRVRDRSGNRIGFGEPLQAHP